MDKFTQKGRKEGWGRIQELENMAKLATWPPPHSSGQGAKRSRGPRKSKRCLVSYDI